MSITPSKAEPGRQWFILANGSRAQAYVKRTQDSGYDQLRAWDAPEARMRDAELGEDKPGRAFAGAGAMHRSAMERDGKDDSPKEHAKRDFLEALAHRCFCPAGCLATPSVTIPGLTPGRAAPHVLPHERQAPAHHY